MKRSNFLITIALFATLGVQAQQSNRPKVDPKERATQMVDELAKQVKISPPIQDSLKVVFVNFYNEMKKGRESGNRPDMMKMESKRDLKVKAFLTDEQYKAYQKFMDERKNRRNRPTGEGGMPERP